MPSDRTPLSGGTDLNSTDSSSEFVPPTQFADAHVRDGKLRLIADPAGEWLESSHVMEVRR